jgi:hypothetical protein
VSENVVHKTQGRSTRCATPFCVRSNATRHNLSQTQARRQWADQKIAKLERKLIQLNKARVELQREEEQKERQARLHRVEDRVVAIVRDAKAKELDLKQVDELVRLVNDSGVSHRYVEALCAYYNCFDLGQALFTRGIRRWHDRICWNTVDIAHAMGPSTSVCGRNLARARRGRSGRHLAADARIRLLC